MYLGQLNGLHSLIAETLPEDRTAHSVLRPADIGHTSSRR